VYVEIKKMASAKDVVELLVGPGGWGTAEQFELETGQPVGDLVGAWVPIEEITESFTASSEVKIDTRRVVYVVHGRLFIENALAYFIGNTVFVDENAIM